MNSDKTFPNVDLMSKLCISFENNWHNFFAVCAKADSQSSCLWRLQGTDQGDGSWMISKCRDSLLCLLEGLPYWNCNIWNRVIGEFLLPHITKTPFMPGRDDIAFIKARYKFNMGTGSGQIGLALARLITTRGWPSSLSNVADLDLNYGPLSSSPLLNRTGPAHGLAWDRPGAS